MRKSVVIILFLFLTGCVREKEEKIVGTFMLRAESEFITPENDQDARVYIIDTYSNTVYIEGKGKTFTKEEREQFESMTAEEREELIGPEVAEDPLHQIKSLDATKDAIVLEYDDEQVEFKALSQSFFETASSVHYRFEKDVSVADYEESLQDP